MEHKGNVKNVSSIEQKDKERLLELVNEMYEIVDKYPWFDPEYPYFSTMVGRVKGDVSGLRRYIECLPVNKD